MDDSTPRLLRSRRHPDDLQAARDLLDASTRFQDVKPGRHTNQLKYIEQNVLGPMLEMDVSWPFKEPVDCNKFADYSTIISHPMDLGTISRKLEQQQYCSAKDCINDFETIFDNCFKYNPKTDDVVFMAKKLQKRYFILLEKMPQEEIELTPRGRQSNVKKQTKTRAARAVKTSVFEYQIPSTSQSTSANLDTLPALESSNDSAEKNTKKNTGDACSKEEIYMPTLSTQQKNVGQVKGGKSGYAGKRKGAVSTVAQGNWKKQKYELSEELKYSLQIIRRMLDKKYITITWPFLNPEVVQDGHTIQNPMDLETIKANLENSNYLTRQEFEADFRLICTNCHEHPSVRGCATKLQKLFIELHAKVPKEPLQFDHSASSIVSSTVKADATDEESKEEFLKSVAKLSKSSDPHHIHRREEVYKLHNEALCKNGLEANQEMEEKMNKGRKREGETTEALAAPSIQQDISDSTEASMPPLECVNPRKKPRQLGSKGCSDNPTEVVKQEKKQGLEEGFRAVQDQLDQTVKVKLNGSEFEQRRQLSDTSSRSSGSETPSLRVGHQSSTNTVQRTDLGRGRQSCDSSSSEYSSVSSPNGGSMEWNYAERRQLAMIINWLPVHKLQASARIVEINEGTLERLGPNVEAQIDFGGLKPSTLDKLQEYVNTQCRVIEPSHIAKEDDGGRQREEGNGRSVSSSIESSENSDSKPDHPKEKSEQSIDPKECKKNGGKSSVTAPTTSTAATTSPVALTEPTTSKKATPSTATAMTKFRPSPFPNLLAAIHDQPSSSDRRKSLQKDAAASFSSFRSLARARRLTSGIDAAVSRASVKGAVGGGMGTSSVHPGTSTSQPAQLDLPTAPITAKPPPSLNKVDSSATHSVGMKGQQSNALPPPSSICTASATEAANSPQTSATSAPASGRRREAVTGSHRNTDQRPTPPVSEQDSRNRVAGVPQVTQHGCRNRIWYYEQVVPAAPEPLGPGRCKLSGAREYERRIAHEERYRELGNPCNLQAHCESLHSLESLPR